MPEFSGVFGILRRVGVVRGLFLLVVLFCSPLFGQEGVGSYERYGGYTFGSVSRYVVSPPRVYSGGVYVGELSRNRYRRDSLSNPYGRYGSRYSPMSVKNPYGRHGVYSGRSVWLVVPR